MALARKLESTVSFSAGRVLALPAMSIGRGAHTSLHRTHVAIEQWERAASWLLANSVASACALQRHLDLGSYRTAWRMARIIRKALQVVEWPLLTGEVELCDVDLARPARPSKSVWLAIERRRVGGGLIRGWRDNRNLRADLRLIASSIAPGATVITPDSGLFREMTALGIRQRSESLGAAAALPGATAAAQSFRRMLQGRRHQGLSPDTLDLYLAEFVFRHNAVALGWKPAEQNRRVLAALSGRA